MFEIPDMRTESRWPLYAAHAAELGIGSVLGFQLSGVGPALGALNLHAARPEAFTDLSREVGTIFAAQAGVAMAWSRTEGQLREAIETRQLIGQAVGILVERRRLTTDAAFELLRDTSARTNVKLRELAERIVETGEDPSTRTS